MAVSTFSAYTPGNFQRQVHYQQAPGVEGDFCDHNPRSSVDAGPGGLVAAPEGVTIARFAWLEYSVLDPNNAPAIARTSSTGGQPAGFIHREQQGLITDYLGGHGMWIPGGFPVTLHNSGGFFVINRGSTYAQVGMKAFARGTDGAVVFGPPGSIPAASAFTAGVAASTFDVAGAITGNVMTVEAVAAGPVVAGATIACAGLPAAAGIKVVRQISGDPGGLGTYALNFAELAIPSGTAIQGTYGLMTVSAMDPLSVGPIGVGTMLNGAAVTTPTTVTELMTGTGGVGDYAVDSNLAIASGALTGGDAIETKWFATSAGNPGDLIKMSSWQDHY
jgi:hypothetical protein